MKFYKNFVFVYIVCGLSVATLVILGIFYIKSNHVQLEFIEKVENNYKLLSAINEVEKLLLLAETDQRGYLLTKEESFKQPFYSALSLLDTAFHNLEIFTGDRADLKANLIQLQKRAAERRAWLGQNLHLTGTEPEYIDILLNGKFSMDKCRQYLDKMRQLATNSLQEKIKEKDDYQQLKLTYFKITFVFACIICLSAIAIFIRELGIRMTTQEDLVATINQLRNSNSELEEITYAASHDLQEPVRKIMVLSTLLSKRVYNKINEEDKEILRRMNNTTGQMQELMHDMVIYFNLLAKDQKRLPVDTNVAFKDAYDRVFEGVDVHCKIVNKLPRIEGYPQQIQNMLIQIFGNSYKFRHPDRDLLITIHYQLKKELLKKYIWQTPSLKQYHQITITDNGIGFNNQYNEKIFVLFKRLLKHDFTGKGIGLAIARRVMMNHNGFIKSRGQEGTGASFILYFPLNNK